MPDDHRSRLVRALNASSRPLDDDELAQRTGIQPRQTVNQLLRRLERDGLVLRREGPANKIVTVLRTREGEVTVPIDAEAVEPGVAVAQPVLERSTAHARPSGSSTEQRDAERVMLDLLGARLGSRLEPVRISLPSGARVEVDGADISRSVLVECWAHQGSPKGGQKHKVLTDALKLTWIASTIYPRPALILCMTDPLAAAPFLPTSTSWAAQALSDLGIRIELVELPEETRRAVRAAQARQFR